MSINIKDINTMSEAEMFGELEILIPQALNLATDKDLFKILMKAKKLIETLGNTAGDFLLDHPTC